MNPDYSVFFEDKFLAYAFDASLLVIDSNKLVVLLSEEVNRLRIIACHNVVPVKYPKVIQTLHYKRIFRYLFRLKRSLFYS